MTASAVFLLGAGSSAPFGIPTMMPFLSSFQALVEKKYFELYGTLAAHISKLPDDADIEALLSSLNSAERLRDGLPPAMSITDDLVKWENESRFLKAHLISYIIERCERFDRSRVAQVLTPLIVELATSEPIREVHLFTTNYDRVVEHACETGDTVFADGFGQSKLAAPWERAFDSKIRLCKLHGSVTYYIDRGSEGKRVFWRLDRGYPLPGPDFRLTRGGRELEPLMVLPTLEKEALGDPYGHLNHLFVDTMASAKVVVAIGTSLRDKHLVSAITYSSANTVLLVVDTDPAPAVARVPGVECVTLKANVEDFLTVSKERLVTLFERCIVEEEGDLVLERVKEFARTEVKEISRWKSMTESQRMALAVLGSGGTESTTLGALQMLYGVADARAMEVVGKLCRAGSAQSVRKAATACLGLSGNPVVVPVLGLVATEDESPDVRLEAYLGLGSVGGSQARKILDMAKHQWPTDGYFQQQDSVR